MEGAGLQWGWGAGDVHLGKGGLRDNLETFSGVKGAPRDVERDFRQGLGVAGQGEWVQTERGEIKVENLEEILP